MNHQAVVVFDGVCNLCNSSVQLILKHDKHKRYSFASLQGEYGQNLLKENGLDPNAFDSFILVENNNLYFASTGALHVAKHMGFPFYLLYPFILVPAFIRDAVYKFIGKNRYKWFGKKESCMIPSPEVQQRFIP